MENLKVEGERSENEDISASEIKIMSEEQQITTLEMLISISHENC